MAFHLIQESSFMLLKGKPEDMQRGGGGGEWHLNPRGFMPLPEWALLDGSRKYFSFVSVKSIVIKFLFPLIIFESS